MSTSVLVAAAGAPWEAAALDHLERGGPGVVVTRRCVDLTDLLATAGAGMASVAVLSPALPGLDADSVSTLRRSGLGVVVVAAPEELLHGDAERLRRLGVDHLLATSELGSLAETVANAGVDTAAVPTAPLDGDDAPGRPAPGRLIAVWGPAGAPGRTTVAVGVAAELAAAGQEVLLLDVDPYGGAVAQHLGVLDGVSSLLAAARAANGGRLDADRLSGFARQVGDRLRVLTGLPRPDRWQEVRPTAFADLLGEAVRGASYTVLDVGFSLERGCGRPVRVLRAPAERDDADVGGARRRGCRRGRRRPGRARSAGAGAGRAAGRGPGVRPRVVVNRTRSSLGWTDREIRGMVEGFLTPADVHFLPEDRAAADRALMAGQSLTESGESPLRAAMAGVARGVLGEPVKTSSPRRHGRRRAR